MIHINGLYVYQYPTAKIWHNTNQTVVNETAINFNTKIWDNDGMYNVSQPNRLTIKTTGIYFIIAQLAYSAPTGSHAGAYMGSRVYLNNTTELSMLFGHGNYKQYQNHSLLYLLNIGDYLTVKPNNLSGGNILESRGCSPFLQVALMSGLG